VSKLQGKDVMAAAIMQGHGQSCRSLARMMAVDESTLRYRLRRFREGAEDGRRRQPESCVTFHELSCSELMRMFSSGAGRFRSRSSTSCSSASMI
jgi:transposase